MNHHPILNLLHVGDKVLVCGALLLLIDFLQSRFVLGISRVTTMIWCLSLVFISTNTLFVLIASALFVIAEIDRISYRIPDVFTKPAILTLSITLVMSPTPQRTLVALSALWLVVMYLLTHWMPESLGRGDVKLIAALLLANGYFRCGTDLEFLVNLLFLSSALALPGAITQRFRVPARHRFASNKPYPFAPAIASAWMLLAGFHIT